MMAAMLIVAACVGGLVAYFVLASVFALGMGRVIRNADRAVEVKVPDDARALTGPPPSP